MIQVLTEMTARFKTNVLIAITTKIVAITKHINVEIIR